MGKSSSFKKLLKPQLNPWKHEKDKFGMAEASTKAKRDQLGWGDDGMTGELEGDRYQRNRNPYQGKREYTTPSAYTRPDRGGYANPTGRPAGGPPPTSGYGDVARGLQGQANAQRAATQGPAQMMQGAATNMRDATARMQQPPQRPQGGGFMGSRQGGPDPRQQMAQRQQQMMQQAQQLRRQPPMQTKPMRGGMGRGVY